MAKALKTAGVIVGVAALLVIAAPLAGVVAAGAISALTFGASLSTLLAISAGLSLGGSLLAPKPKTPNVSDAATNRLNASLVLRTPRTFVFGRTAMATDIRDQELSTDQVYLHRWIVVASHKVQAIEELWLDDKQAWTAAGGVTAAFTGYLTVTPVLEGSAANAINTSPRMGATRRYTGCAYLYVRFRVTGLTSKATSPFASSVPSRTTIIGKGCWLYDPRLDGTAGGAGPQRASDQTTWAWDDSACRNPALQMLAYLLGWRIQNPATAAFKLAVGKGIPPARINLASFITAANLCDEAVSRAAGGTEPRYRSDGIFSEGDDLSTVLDNFKAAMNAVLDDVDGKIRVTCLSNDLASPIGSLTTGDVLGAFTWTQTPPLSDSFNVVRGGYTDPSTTSLYQIVDYPEVSVASPDGIERVSTVNLPLVQSPSQAQRLAKMRLQRALYGGTFEAVFSSVAWKFQKGDCIQLTFGPLGWANKLFRIAALSVQVDGTVPMTLREENAAIYAWSASDAPAVSGVAPTSYDPLLSPVVQGIGDAATTATWPGVSNPAGTKPADNAGTSLSLIAGGPNHAVQGNMVTRTGSGWSTTGDEVTSRESYATAVVSGQFVASASEFLFGLCDGSNPYPETYWKGDFIWIKDAAGNVTPLWFGNTGANGSFASATIDYTAVYAVSIDRLKVIWTKNGAVITSMAAPYNDARPYRLLAAGNGTGATAVNLQIAPFTNEAGKQLIDQTTGRITSPAGLPPIVAQNLGYKFKGTPTYSAAAGSPATATITIAPAQLLGGDTPISYGTLTCGVTGTGGTTATYQLYVEEPNPAALGGSKTLMATTNGDNVYAGTNRVWLGACSVVFPSSGSGTGSGGAGGGSGYGGGYTGPIP